MRDIKIIWDFRGPASEQTAKHHAIHLKEYAVFNNIPYLEINATVISEEIHAIAFIAVKENYITEIREQLKPHRAELYNS